MAMVVMVVMMVMMVMMAMIVKMVDLPSNNVCMCFDNIFGCIPMVDIA
jgi:hypothetical protein